MRAAGPRVTMAFVLTILVGVRVLGPPKASPQVERSASVLSAARQALGGSERLAAVRSLVATGRTRQVRGDNLVPIEFQMMWEFPDRYVRTDEFPTQDSGPVTAGFAGNALIQAPGSRNRPTSVVTLKEDLARVMLGLFAGAVSVIPLTFTYAGIAEAPQGQADVLDAKRSADAIARLFVDTVTHLPIMVTWQTAAPGGPSAQALVEHRLYFGDYRDVDGLKWPFRTRRAVGPDPIEETVFDRFRINVKIDPKRFEVAP
jgi:hypothetical protein